MADRLNLQVNGEERAVVVEPDTPLLYVLRNDLELDGPKFGCGLSQCGACAVLRDGIEIRSCVTPVSAVAGAEITTSEGLGSEERPNALQAAFIAEQVPQCGYCISGMMIAASSLLERNPNPTRDEIKTAMNGHLCRCGAHLRIIRAISRAAREGEPV
ncbi:MAG: (2Fe-2S)-binding protein [Micropepsaceae bacterium]